MNMILNLKNIQAEVILVENTSFVTIFCFAFYLMTFDSLFMPELSFAQLVGHGVPKGGQKEKKLSGFGAYIFGISIPRGFRLL